MSINNCIENNAGIIHPTSKNVGFLIQEIVSTGIFPVYCSYLCFLCVNHLIQRSLIIK